MSVIKPNTQVKILSEEHSRCVQDLATANGFNWGDCGDSIINVPTGDYIKFRASFRMTLGCKENNFKEVVIDLPQPSIESKILAEKVGKKFDHYFKDVSDIDEIDVYRVCDLFEINDNSGAIHHAIKKLLCSGIRGAKDYRKDLEEARDSINRKLQMMSEDGE